MTPIRVLHAPEMVAGNAPELARAERRIGLKSWCVSFERSRYGYEVDEILFAAADGAITREIKRLRLLARALRRYDVVHFNFGSTFLPIARLDGGGEGAERLYNTYARLVQLRDLPLLKAAGKGIVMTYQGDDARQGDVLRAQFDIHPADEAESEYYTPISDEGRRERIAFVARYADKIYSLNPDLLHVLPLGAEFLPYSHIDIDSVRPRPPNRRLDHVRILHAPSLRSVKGTRHVISAVESLKEQGLPVELALVEGLSHDQALREYAKADLVVDQLLYGWYGGFAVEAMALGKPVVAYIRPEDLEWVPREMRDSLPIINANAHSLEQVLMEWVTIRRDELADVGELSRAFVEAWHRPTSVAERTRATYQQILKAR